MGQGAVALHDACDRRGHGWDTAKIKSLCEQNKSKKGFVDCFESYAAVGPMTPLMRASKCGQHSCVQTFLDYGADIKIKNESGRTALHFAIDSSQGVQCLHLLLQHLTTKVPKAERYSIDNLLLHATKGGGERDEKNKNMEKLTTRCGDDDDERRNMDHHLRAAAAKKCGDEDDNEKKIMMLIEFGANVHDAVDSEGCNVLHLVARHSGNLSTAKLFIERGVDLAAKNNVGFTPAFEAKSDAMKALLSCNTAPPPRYESHVGGGEKQSAPGPDEAFFSPKMPPPQYNARHNIG